MKKFLIFACAILLMFFAFNYSTLASVIEVEVTEGASVSLERYLKPSGLAEPVVVTGSYGLNEHLLLKCAYVTEEQRNIIGGRYAFNEKMAATVEYEWKDSDNSYSCGFIYKLNFNDKLDLIGLLEYKSEDIALTSQVEYKFGDPITVNAGIKYIIPDQGDALIYLLVGAEYKPIDIFSLYFDYLIPEEGASRVYCGVAYRF